MICKKTRKEESVMCDLRKALKIKKKPTRGIAPRGFRIHHIPAADKPAVFTKIKR